MRSTLLPVLFFVLSSSCLEAQLRADFNLDKTGGCSPLSVSFTNASTGTSANTVYDWDFGNGNTSVLENAGAVYYEEKSYTVKLTIKEGTQVSTQTKTVTVYKKPVVDFRFSPDNGCLPLLVTFTSLSTAGDGTISAYHWDFGDGVVQQASGPSQAHSYNFSQLASVSLTAVNNYGCSHSLTKEKIITVHPSLKADFSAGKTIHCNAPATVNFFNTSTGPGILTYEWDFGDGNTSSERTPSHTYTTKCI